jgi:hypothetical protein
MVLIQQKAIQEQTLHGFRRAYQLHVPFDKGFDTIDCVIRIHINLTGVASVRLHDIDYHGQQGTEYQICVHYQLELDPTIYSNMRFL